MMHGADVPIPPRLARRPRDRRGYPIPYGITRDAQGVPDFRVPDADRWLRAYQHQLCGLCGEKLGRHMAFIGGPLCEANRVFLDLPMHRDCAEYALQVCPYLALPKATYAKEHAIPEGTHVSSHVDPTRPERFWLGITTGYRGVMMPDGQPALQALPWTGGAWWRDGQLEPGA